MTNGTNHTARLPAGVAAALADPPAGSPGTAMEGGLAWRSVSWGAASAPPVLLVHGVTSSSGTFWRVGPAIAAAGYRVVAVDLPGHGRTGGWRGRHRFAQTAEDLRGFIRAAGLDRPDLAVLGHSWGGMVVAELPGVGFRPRVLVLLDPPALPLDEIRSLTESPLEQPYATLAAAVAACRAAEPGWHERDIVAKAESLTQFDAAAVLAVLLENGGWDAGLSALSVHAAAGLPVWLIRGETATGGLIPEDAVPALAARFGADHVITLPGAPHSPQRTHPEETVVAVLRALGPAPRSTRD